jgi:pimeloyl-ACP methyl ester carboxylesterase
MEIKEKEGFSYIDEGEGDILLLLHGLFGMLSNWEGVINKFSSTSRIIIPILPIYDMPLRQSGLEGLTAYVEGFVDMMKLENMSVMGNSLGGHIGLMYTLNNEDKVKNLILTGSSGLFENSMGGSYPKRGDYNYIKERVGYTFYDPTTVGDEYVDELFEILKSIPKTLRIVAIAKSAQRNNMANDIVNIKVPTLLIWGLNDTITPPAVAHEFNKLIPNSTLRFIDKCCHAPMMERPDEYNVILENYLMAQE